MEFIGCDSSNRFFFFFNLAVNDLVLLQRFMLPSGSKYILARKHGINRSRIFMNFKHC